MRVRSVLITTIAGLAFIGASATAASAYTPPQQCCGEIKQAPNTPTTMKPIDAYEVTPTTQPPKGPGDIAQPPKGPGPQDGPDDIAPAPQDDNPGPQDKAPVPPKSDDDGVDPGEYGNGSGSDNYVPPANGDGSSDNGNGAEFEPVSSETESDTSDESSEQAAREDADESSRVPAFAIIFFALLTAGLIGLVVARMRNEDEDAETV